VYFILNGNGNFLQQIKQAIYNYFGASKKSIKKRSEEEQKEINGTFLKIIIHRCKLYQSSRYLVNNITFDSNINLCIFSLTVVDMLQISRS